MEVGVSARCTTVLSGLSKAGRGTGGGVGDPGDTGGLHDGRGQSEQRELMVPPNLFSPACVPSRHISKPPLQLGLSCDSVIANGM